jgi:hypothetical protein
MQRRYLGDSYDLVKRHWAQSLFPIGPLFAHPKFVPDEIGKEYELVTAIPVFDLRPATPFGLLLDPDTGIPLPTSHGAKVSRSHAPLSYVIDVYEQSRPAYLICFDQSYHRKHDLKRADQMESKMNYLRDRGLYSFYYDSHAPFLFISDNVDTLSAIRDRLSSLGIPQSRLGAANTFYES